MKKKTTRILNFFSKNTKIENKNNQSILVR